MADKTITDLTASGPLDGLEIFHIVQSGNSRKTTLLEVLKAAAAGSAANPSISFAGDPNTGIYNPAADQIAQVTNGIQRTLLTNTAFRVSVPLIAHTTPNVVLRNYVTDAAWLSSTSAADNDWWGVCWSPELGLFCAVAAIGTGNRVMTSPDGITWTTRTSAANNGWRSVCWSPELGLFCAVAISGTGNRVMTSVSGNTFTYRS